jgi:hypothetical protein
MSLFTDAFGIFEPHRDKDAGGKLVLESLFTTNRLDDLAEMLTSGSRLGGLGGEPGWTLERRDEGNSAPGYASWPEGARYRTFVDPEAFALATPERYYARDEFHQLVKTILNAYTPSGAAKAVTGKILRLL